MSTSMVLATPVPALPPKIYFKVKDVAELIGVSNRFVYRLVARGDIKAKRLGNCVLIPRSEVLRLTGIEESSKG